MAGSAPHLGGYSAQLTDCPAIFWNERGANFIVCKAAADDHRCLCSYPEAERDGTGYEE